MAQGDAVVHISAANLGQLQLSLPPLSEQRAIASALSDVDALISSSTSSSPRSGISSRLPCSNCSQAGGGCPDSADGGKRGDWKTLRRLTVRTLEVIHHGTMNLTTCHWRMSTEVYLEDMRTSCSLPRHPVRGGSSDQAMFLCPPCARIWDRISCLRAVRRTGYVPPDSLLFGALRMRHAPGMFSITCLETT